MDSRMASPKSRADIRRYAKYIRSIIKCENEFYFPIVEFVEWTMPKLIPDYTFEVLPQSEMAICHGLTFPNENRICIREDVYERALEDSGRDRLTIAHELFHLLAHEKDNVVSFARADVCDISAYCNPEWQADAFGGELLIPKHLITGMTPDEIVKRCKVSRAAVEYQLRVK